MGARALAGALAMLLAAAAGSAGWSFVWCAPMQEARVHCCCPPAPRTHDVISRSCCDERSVPSLPELDGHADAVPKLVAAPLLAVLPLWAWLGGEGGDEGALRELDVEARAGPTIRRHVAISVFLI